MKKILSNVYMLAALFILGAAITSCSKSDDTPTPEPKPVGPTTYTMTIKATKAADAKTRALSFDGDGKLNATWATTENVYVKKGSTWASDGSLKPQTAGAEAVLKGSITMEGGIAAGDALTLQFPKDGDITYSGQLGTLSDIAANFDWATATVDVESVSASGDITPKAVTTTFTNQQAIIKFTLVDKANDAAISPSSLTVTDGTSTVSLTNISAATYTANEATNVLYVAFPAAETAKTITLTAIVGNNVYTYEKSDATFYNGRYYAINVKMTKTGVYYPTPLTIENCGSSGSSVTVSDFVVGKLKYSTDGGSNWVTPSDNFSVYFSADVTKVCFIGDQVTKGKNTRIICTDNCYIYGNIMSLLYEDYATKTTLPYEDTFISLFQGNANIKHTEGKDLVLPATKLISQCYTNMFNGCTQLDHIKCLATEDLDAFQCTSTWLEGTPATGTFIKAKGASWTTDSDSGIPSGWTVIEE